MYERETYLKIRKKIGRERNGFRKLTFLTVKAASVAL